jgi:phosphate transport system permease protein
VARLLITTGGIGTIVAVSVLCVFLVWVVVPLFQAPRGVETPVGRPEIAGADVAIGLDEYGAIGWSASQAGEIVAFQLEDGRELERERPFGSEEPCVLAISAAEGSLVSGFRDGSARLAAVRFATAYLGENELPGELRSLARGARARHGSGILEHTPSGQFRLQELLLSAQDPVELGAGRALRLVDGVDSSAGPILAGLTEDDLLRVARGTRETNLLTGEERVEWENGELALEFPEALGAPRWLSLTGLGDNVLLTWEDGMFWRCDARELSNLRMVEKRDLLPEEGARVSALAFLIGRTSLAVGESTGRLRVWFRTKPDEAGTPDGINMAQAHELGGPGPAVRSLFASARGRTLAAGYDDGSVRLFHVTSGRELLALALPGEREPVTALAIAPKDDALLAYGRGAHALWRLDVPHPETSLAAVFGPVWYEGYPAPEHVWQSSSGTDDFEPKYGLWPLVFGTVKATFYSLLFGVPIALLAAVYTSEFLHPRTRARVKPTIEMMASLPSVVLGFLSALVIAPLVEDVVPGVLTTIALLPSFVCLGGHLWRLLPAASAVVLERFRLVFVGLFLALAAGAGAWLGPVIERALFAGDFRQWLTGSVGAATGGWMILLLPALALGAGGFMASWVNPRLLRAVRGHSRARFALLDLAKFLAGTLGVLALAWVLASFLERAGLDPRGGLLDTYVQRNALVVGFVMGFAIIPIIYTIAEDALFSVPDDLRAASLAAGATRWQTAVRVVVPTAMSGIFSAVMIGLGRAVGETMIVLMAAGNTPIMDWNVFNGFRTLSANIAVELPEAVQGSTHYRMLFLAALVLFAMTFALNTLAEAVRLRYRRRRVQL